MRPRPYIPGMRAPDALVFTVTYRALTVLRYNSASAIISCRRPSARTCGCHRSRMRVPPTSSPVPHGPRAARAQLVAPAYCPRGLGTRGRTVSASGALVKWDLEPVLEATGVLTCMSA